MDTITRVRKLAVLGLIALALPVTLSAQSTATVRVTAERTSVRDRPASAGAIVATAVRGDQLRVIDAAGAWWHVRLPNGKDGFVQRLAVEHDDTPAVARDAASAAPRNAAAAQTPAGPAGGAGSAAQPAPASTAGASLPRRTFGVGLDNVGPSVRYWMDARKGVQVDAYFSSSFGYSVSAIAPSFISHFGDAKASGAVTFLPYWGGGVEIWHWADGYYDYYCGRNADCGSSTTIGYGGFVGSELVFTSFPKLAISGHARYYTSHLGYGGFGLGVGIHFYPGMKKP